MAMNNTSWGDAVAAAVQAVGVSAGTPITPLQLKLIWRAVKGEDVTHLIANAEITDVVSSGNTQTGPAGGPLPITSLPGTGSITA